MGDRVVEGRAHGNLGRFYHSVGELKQAIKYHFIHLNIAKELGDRVGEGTSYGDLGRAFESLGDFKKAMEYHKQHLSIVKEMGDKSTEGSACYSLGCVFESMRSLHEALDYFRSSLKTYNGISALLGSEAALKISFCNIHQDVHTALRRTLLKLQITDKALCVVKKGLTQTVTDLIPSPCRYGLLPYVSDEPRPAQYGLTIKSISTNSLALCRGKGFLKAIEGIGVRFNDESGKEKNEPTKSRNNPLRLLFN